MRTVLALAVCVLSLAASAQDAADLEEAAHRFEAVVAAGDPDTLAAHYDETGYFDRALVDLDPAFGAGVRQGARQTASFPQQVANALSWGGSYQFLRVVEREGEARARFRFVAAGGGLNYHDLLLEPGPDGTYRFVDAYTFLGGEDMSESAHRLLAGLAEAHRGDAASTDRALQVAAMAEAAQRGDYHAVVETYPRIGVREADRKPLLVLYLLAAAEVSPADYAKALEIFQHEFADDPTADIVLIDRHYLRGDMPAVLQAVDRLDAGVGGDPYLDAYRARALLDMDQFDDAQAAADRLAEALPDLSDGPAIQLEVALVQEDFQTVTDLMLHLQREFEFEFYPEVLKRDPLWAGFVASPQYKVWAAESRW